MTVRAASGPAQLGTRSGAGHLSAGHLRPAYLAAAAVPFRDLGN